jgi:hypothetical protein
MTLLLKSIVVWLIFILAESLNGMMRILWLIPAWGDVLAHQISFVIGTLLILAIAILFVPWLQIRRLFPLLTVGILWALLTLAFEIALGYMIFGYSWEQIMADYNLRQGGLMPFGLAWLALSPAIAARIRGLLLHEHPQVSEQ